MSFADSTFIYFLLIFACLWLLTRGKYLPQLGVMLVGSLVFYSYNRWWLLGLIASYCVVDWGVGLGLRRTHWPRVWLALGIGFNLGVLGFWKYTPLVARTAFELFGWSIVAPSSLEGWAIPIGISFYAFTGISYMVDVFRGVIEPERSLLRYSVYTAFFPHLMAGPILRAREFLVDLRPGKLPDRSLASWEGTFLLARGFFKKIVLADTIALSIDPFFANMTNVSTAGVWALPYLYLYSLQIYFDFSGYTDIARGLGLWFGFRWPDNFNWPYLANSAQEFWRRWNMTLSRFLRDYLYVPLGGGRHGRWRTALNLMITMLLGGLWHGASWSFMIWGGLHGLYLVIHRAWMFTPVSGVLARITGPARWLWTTFCIGLTFNAVAIAWCFFRITDFNASCACVGKWFAFDRMLAGGSADLSLWALLGGYAAATIAAVVAIGNLSLAEVPGLLAKRPMLHGLSWGIAIGLLLIAFLIAPGGERQPFIYFQF